MRKNSKYTYLSAAILIFLIIFFAPVITYRIDSNLVHRDKRPIFIIKKAMYKDGGTTEYRGLGYQVIKWNIRTNKGIELGYEIYKSPNFRDVNDGPTRELRVVPK